MASGSRWGEPSVIRPRTRSGRRAASDLGHAAAAALADHHRPLALLGDQALEPRLETVVSAPAAVDVGHHPGPRGPEAGAAQPVGHRRQRAVAGEEARDQQHRAPAAVAEAVARAGSGRAAMRRPRGRIGPPAREAGANSEASPSWRVLNLLPRTAGTCPVDFAPVRAVTIQDGSLVVEQRPDPEPSRGEILVRVRAAGLNGADMLQVRGAYPAPPGSPPDIPGLELAGEVAALGPGAERFEVGDRVMAVVGGGGQAELAVVHERAAMPVPDAPRLATGGRRARGVHHRPRRGLHPGRAAPRRAPARPRGGRRSGDGGGAARPRRRRARDGDRPARGAARGRRAAGREGDRARGLRRARPLRRRARAGRRRQPAREPEGARDRGPDRRDRHRRQRRRRPSSTSGC